MLTFNFTNSNSNFINMLSTNNFNWDKIALSNIKTKEEYTNLLQNTFGDNLIFNDVINSTFDFVSGISGGISIRLGINDIKPPYFHAENLKDIATSIPSIYKIKNFKKPKYISCKFNYNNVSNVITIFALIFTGTSSNKSYMPMFFADFSNTINNTADGGIYINDGNNKIRPINSNWNYMSINLDIEKDCNLCFVDPKDTFYTMSYVCTKSYNGNVIETTSPVYIEELSIQ